MMRFVLRQTKSGCRLGQFIDVSESVSKKCVETPMCILYTRAGSVPCLGRDVLDRIEGHPAMINMPLGLLVESHEAIAEFPGGMKKFAVMDDFLLYCSLQDPAVVTPIDFNTKHAIAVWGRRGKFMLDTVKYTKVLAAMQADWAQSLANCDADTTRSLKRIKKSVDRALDYLDDLITKCKESEKLKSTQLIGTVLGGYNLQERLRSAQETAKRPVAGYSVEGLHNFGLDSEKFDLGEVKEMLQKTLEELPPDKPRILPGPMDPGDIFTAVELGFDILDTSYTYLASERGAALSYSYQVKSTVDTGTPTSTDTEISTSTDTDVPPSTEHTGWEILLKDKKYAEDLNPLVSSCTCYTCRNHTRAYIHHLLNVSELLAPILLNIHNLHHYLRTFEVIRKSLADDTFQQLKKHIQQQRTS